MHLLVCFLALILIAEQFAFGEPVKLAFQRQPISATLHNRRYDLDYLINITVGTPPQALQLELDTGSREIWVIWST
jgi:hypothetical protein